MFDPTKPVQTRDGRKARILCTDRKSYTDKYSIVALIEKGEGHELTPTMFTAAGRFYDASDGGETPEDLVNIPTIQKRTFWINCYPAEGRDTHYTTKELADKHASSSRVACIQLTYEVTIS